MSIVAMNDNTLVEAGERYSHVDVGHPYVRMQFKWLFIPNGQTGEHSIYILGGRPAMLNLLNHWNRSDKWKFWMEG